MVKTYSLLFNVAAGTNDNDTPSRATLRVDEGIVAAAPDDDERSQSDSIEINFVRPHPTLSDPTPISIELVNNLLVPAAGFTGDSFDIIVTLSEQPKEGKFTRDHLDIDTALASDGVYLGPVDPPQGQTATGRSGDYHQFLFTITPKVEDVDLVIKIKSFEDQEKPIPNKYIPPTSDFGRTEGKDILTVKIGKRELEDDIIVIEISVPRDTVIPGTGNNTKATATTTAEKSTVDTADATPKATDTSVRIPEAGPNLYQ